MSVSNKNIEELSKNLKITQKIHFFKLNFHRKVIIAISTLKVLFALPIPSR